MTEPAAVPTVFLVDDHRLFLSGVRNELGDRFEIVGQASEVDEAVAAIRAARPDVVLLDVHMPGGGGRAVTSRSGSSPSASPTPPRTSSPWSGPAPAAT
jgi:DNA-binding NarL/FixJ family response regulator